MSMTVIDSTNQDCARGFMQPMGHQQADSFVGSWVLRINTLLAVQFSTGCTLQWRHISQGCYLAYECAELTGAQQA